MLTFFYIQAHCTFLPCGKYNTSFSKEAGRVSNKVPFIELLTLRKLEDSLFEFTNIYKLFKEKYEASDIFNNYIPLKGLSSESISLESVEEKIIEWVKEPKLYFLTIFGDYGSGKTTLLERIKYYYVLKYLKEESSIKPIIIYLKDFQKYKTLENLLHHSILREFNREIPLELFHMAIAKGAILLLLDGFDEMVQQIDREKRRENFIILSQLLPANAIITCRPAYFISLDEYKGYLYEIKKQEGPVDLEIKQTKTIKRNANKDLYEELNQYLYENIVTRKPIKNIEFVSINLKEFDGSQIDIYLAKFDKEFIEKYNQNWKKIKKILLSIYDIKDLMSRPILLKMIVTTILFDKFDLNRNILNIGPASLYDSYTSHYLEIEWNKGESRQLLTSTERAKFAMAIAMTMFENEKLEVSYQEVIQVISSNVSIGNIAKKIELNSIENIASDIQLCAFLTVSRDFAFRFVHKSFMEFYIAKFLRDLILKDEINIIFDRFISKEILYFLSGFCLVNEDLKQGILRWHQKDTHSYFAPITERFERNVSCAVILSGVELKKITFFSILISFIQIEGKIFDSCKFEKVILEEVELSGCKFYNSILKHTSFKKTLLNNVLILGEEIQIDFFESEVNNSQLSCQKISITSLGSRIQSSKFHAKEIILGGNPKFQACEFRDCKFSFNTNYSSFDIEFKATNFYKASLSMEKLDPAKVNFYDCKFYQSELKGLIFQQAEYNEISFQDCNGYILIKEFFYVKNEKLAQMKSNVIQDSYLIVGQLLVIYEPKWRSNKNDILNSIEGAKIIKKINLY